MKVEGNYLLIAVDLTKDFGESKSGKSITIGSTEGNISIPDNEDKKNWIKCLQEKIISIIDVIVLRLKILSKFLFSDNNHITQSICYYLLTLQ